MKYLSVCSGIEAATVAWHSLGWTPWAFSEIEQFPSAVLAHHYPNTPNLGDMTKFKEWPDADVDVLVGGTPCQSFSVAGLRKGLDDPRGNLMLTYLAIAAKYRPRWLVWENVPGVLSSNGGLDFATLLRGMEECGYGVAYRVLDAQYFGVAQRRRRVFVVGCLGSWQRAAAVLFEQHSLQGHPAPSREAGKDASERPVSCIDASFGRLQGCSGQDSNHGHSHLITAFGGTLKACKDSGGWSNSADHAAAGYMQPVGTQVRRLTPVECSRLQGFPDDYLTQVPWRGKVPPPDGPMYKALGNSMAVPVMAWIGKRIQMVEDIIAEKAA